MRVVFLSSTLEKACSAGVDRTFSLCILSLHNLFSSPFPPRNKPRLNDPTTNLHALSQHTDPGCCALLTCTHIHNFQNAIGELARTPQLVIAAMHGVAFRLMLDTLCAIEVRLAASDVSFSIRVDVGLEADLGTLKRVLLGLGSCDVPALQAVVVTRKSPVAIVEIKQFIAHALDHLCVFFSCSVCQ